MKCLVRHLAPLGVLLFLSHQAVADVSRDIRDGRLDLGNQNGGFFEIGPRLDFSSIPVTGVEENNLNFSVHIGGYYRFKRFFVDIAAESHSRVQFGYNALSRPLWSIDLLAASSEAGIDSRFSDELEDIDSRPGGLNFGVRVTAYPGSLIAQFEALADVSGRHDGFTMTGSLARNWLVRNWNVHAILGARYYSASYTDYIFGIDEDEASDRFPEYEAGTSAAYVTEVGASYPMSEYWVFRTTARYWALSDSMARSPFLFDDDFVEIASSIMFVY